MLEYFLIKPNGETTGTFTIEQIRAMLSSGFIDHDTRYWHEGVSDWKPIDQIEESLKFEPPTPVDPAKTISSQRVAQVLKAVPPPSTKIARSKTEEHPDTPGDRPYIPPSGKVPKTGLPMFPSESVGEHDVEFSEEDVPVADTEPFAPEAEPVYLPSRKTSLTEKITYVLLGAILVLAVDRGPSLVKHINDALAAKVSLAGDETFVLLDQNGIKSFHQELANSPTVQALQDQLLRTAEPMALQRLKIGIETERARHYEQVRQQYLQNNIAAYIDPGTYRVLGTFDENGNPVTPAKDQPVWVAISYHQHTVYAFKAPGTSQPVASN
jgi:hypothetical protein